MPELNPAAETPRDRFLRNHQENIGTMRAALVRAERENSPNVEMIRSIVQAWERIGKQAESEGAT